MLARARRSRLGAEELLAVAAAKQEDEPLQVVMQVGQPVGGVAGETTQVSPQAPGAAFLGFESSRVGRWISDERDIWTTRDGGLHWLRRAFR